MRSPTGPLCAGPGRKTPARHLKMGLNTFERITSRDNLNDTWKRLYSRTRPSSRNTRGVDGQSINDFAIDANANLTKLFRNLRENKFNFDPLKSFLIPKKNGKDRLICVPTVRDRIVQRVLLENLSSKYANKLGNNINFGFVRGRSVKMAVSIGCNLRGKYPWVFKTDIASFFDKIDRQILMSRVRGTVRQRSLHEFLSSAMSSEIEPLIGSKAKRIAKLGLEIGMGVRQGMPLSPFFANLMLIQFDKAIEERGFNAVRYADDLIFFAKSEVECLKIEQFCIAELQKLKLEIPPISAGTKSFIYKPGEVAEFLGVGLCLAGASYNLQIMPEQITKIRQEILSFGSINELVTRKINLSNLSRTLTAKINGYLSAYELCSNVDELERNLMDLEQRVLRKIYSVDLGIDITKLTLQKRLFLALS